MVLVFSCGVPYDVFVCFVVLFFSLLVLFVLFCLSYCSLLLYLSCFVLCALGVELFCLFECLVALCCVFGGVFVLLEV